jgi:hypothetical protein
MMALGGDVTDHAALAVIMAIDFDASKFAQGRCAAVGGDGDARFHAQAVIERERDALIVLLECADARRAAHGHAGPPQCRPQAILQQTVFDDPSQLRHCEGIGIEA